jgi:hypothetical protein
LATFSQTHLVTLYVCNVNAAAYLKQCRKIRHLHVGLIKISVNFDYAANIEIIADSILISWFQLKPKNLRLAQLTSQSSPE